jgi:putative aldouronate transport system permease protein
LVGSNGNLFPVADIIDTFIFRALISSADIGMSSASGFYQSAMCLITILIANKLVKIFQPDYSLF